MSDIRELVEDEGRFQRIISSITLGVVVGLGFSSWKQDIAIHRKLEIIESRIVATENLTISTTEREKER